MQYYLNIILQDITFDLQINNSQTSLCTLLGDRLHALDIGVTNISLDTQGPGTEPDYKICTNYPGPGKDNDTVELQCSQLVWGRYLYMQIQDTGSILTLCEVEAWPGQWMLIQCTEVKL